MRDVKISKKTRDRFKEHHLVADLQSKPTQDNPFLAEGRRCVLLRCFKHCDWLGWVPLDEILALRKEQGKS